MPFTQSEQASFSAAQLVQLRRMSDDRITEVGRAATDRVKWTRRLATYSAAQLRARVNIASVVWAGSRPTIVWAPENDYSSAERQSISDGVITGDKPLFRAAEIVP